MSKPAAESGGAQGAPARARNPWTRIFLTTCLGSTAIVVWLAVSWMVAALYPYCGKGTDNCTFWQALPPALLLTLSLGIVFLSGVALLVMMLAMLVMVPLSGLLCIVHYLAPAEDDAAVQRAGPAEGVLLQQPVLYPGE
ncbi:MAG TPA: hypothetical protein VKD22_11400 [Ramlibacter sp.]|nr:hypothetical protein [Ramlibacter sp.]